MKLYRPSNGTEGMIFEDMFCDRCTHEDSENRRFCDIHNRAILHGVDEPEYPQEWAYISVDNIEQAVCTAFKDKDLEPEPSDEPERIYDPNQMELFA